MNDKNDGAKIISELFKKESERHLNRKRITPYNGKQESTIQIIYNYFIEHRMKGISESVVKDKNLSSHVYAFLLTRDKGDKYHIESYDGFLLEEDGAYDFYSFDIFKMILNHGDAEYVDHIEDYVIKDEYYDTLESMKINSHDWYIEYLLIRLDKFFDEYYAIPFQDIVDEYLYKINL